MVKCDLRTLAFLVVMLAVGAWGCEDDHYAYMPTTDSQNQDENQQNDHSDKPNQGEDDASKTTDQEKQTTDVSCEDDCTLGINACDEAGRRICGYFDPDPCTDWSEPQPCAFGCDENQSCREGAIIEPCQSACVNGSTECVDNGFRVCADTDQDGCTEWSAVTPCGQEEACTGGVCQKQAPSCTNACVAGKTECSGDGFRACADADGDGCTEWGAVQKCDHGCDAGHCKDDPNDWVPACTTSICPKVITSFPYQTTGNTASSSNRIDAYSCDSTVSEVGPEEYYVFRVKEPGTVVAGITEPSKGDVDVHLLRSLSAEGCISRSDKGVGTHVEPGIYYLSIDTYASSSKAGAYNLYVTFLPDSGKCGLAQTTINRYNTPSRIDLPQTGKIVKEAHMVTDHDQAVHGDGWWPTSSRENLEEHKRYTAQITGFTSPGAEAWCPAGEGDCQYGQGSTGVAVPALAEAWYVCMYWKNKPTKGTRFLVMNPANGKAVVAAAGYETGPGDGTRLGGAVEEIHEYCGTSHLGTLMFAELKDQTLPYGVISCDD